MRPKYVPVRLAATVLAVAATAGCMSVGEDEGGRAKPSHSAGHRGGEAPDGGPAGVGSGYMGAAGGDGKHRHGKGKGGPRPTASGAASPSAGGTSASASPRPVQPGRTEKPGVPTPTKEPSTAPTRSPDPEPPAPTPEPPSPTPEPTVAEPSSSAHEGENGGTTAQLMQREPAPEAGSPV